MGLLTRRIEVDVEVDGVTVKGQTLSTVEQTELRQGCYIDVVREQVDALTEKPLEPKVVTVFSPSKYERLLWVKTVVSLSENAVNLEGEQLEVNEKNLGDIFDWNRDFVEAVVKKLNSKFKAIKKGELKNSKLGATGTLPQAEQPASSAEKKS